MKIKGAPIEAAIKIASNPFNASYNAVGIAYGSPKTRNAFAVPAFLVPSSLISIPFNLPKR